MLEFAGCQCPAADLCHRASRYGPRQGHQKGSHGAIRSELGQGEVHKLLRPSHGAFGQGDGPVASEFKVAPANLTQFTKNNHGEFPSSHLWAILQFAAPPPARGSSNVPVWATCSVRWIRMIR
jgi:hypothetical protein